MSQITPIMTPEEAFQFYTNESIDKAGDTEFNRVEDALACTARNISIDDQTRNKLIALGFHELVNQIHDLNNVVSALDLACERL